MLDLQWFFIVNLVFHSVDNFFVENFLSPNIYGVYNNLTLEKSGSWLDR